MPKDHEEKVEPAEQHNDCDNLRGHRGILSGTATRWMQRAALLRGTRTMVSGWEVDPNSLEGDAGELTTRPKLEGT